MRKFAIIGLVTAMIVGLAGCGTTTTPTTSNSDNKPAQVKVMKFTTSTTKQLATDVYRIYDFKQEVEKESGGSIKVEVYPDGQLGGDVQSMEGLRAGTIQATSMTASIVANLDKRFNILSLPFLFDGPNTFYKVADGPVGKELLSGLENYGIVGAGIMDAGFRDLTNSKKTVTSPEDLKGLKIRVLENPIQTELWKDLGAIPTPMAFTELFSALQQHVVDGEENAPVTIQSAKLNEVQKYLTVDGHLYDGQIIMFSKKFYDSLTDKEKKIVMDAAQHETANERVQFQKLNNDAINSLKQNGMVVTELTPDQRTKFSEATKPVYKMISDMVGADLVDKIVKAANDAKK